MEKIVQLKNVSLRGKVLRLFGMNRGFEQSSSSQKKILAHTHSQVSKKRLSGTLVGVEASLISNRRIREVQAEKAMVSMLSRFTTAHDRQR